MLATALKTTVLPLTMFTEEGCDVKAVACTVTVTTACALVTEPAELVTVTV